MKFALKYKTAMIADRGNSEATATGKSYCHRPRQQLNYRLDVYAALHTVLISTLNARRRRKYADICKERFSLSK